MTKVFIMVFFILASFARPAYCWQHEPTHMKDLTMMALDLVDKTTKDQEYSQEIWKEFAEFIMHGARDEDLPCKVFQLGNIAPDYYLGPPVIGFKHYLRANNHYGHAIAKGVGLTCSLLPKGDQDTSPLNWAKTNKPFKYDEEFGGGEDWEGLKYAKKYGGWTWTERDLSVGNGNMSWKNAIDRYGYTEQSKALAYYTLGFILHLLQDMGEPEHVHDDAHGGSSFTGFEKFMEDNWGRLQPNIEKLRPWRPESKGSQHDLFSDIDDYFDRLGKIAYSATRFRGFNEGGDPKKIEKGSDLERMFDVEWGEVVTGASPAGLLTTYAWTLKNKKKAKEALAKEALSKKTAMPDTIDRQYHYFPNDFSWDPAGHKSRWGGDWWPTSGEMGNIGRTVDAEGYYYIELSSDLPWESPSEKYDLYPMAYLPSPLPAVEQECRGEDWKMENLDGTRHLYDILAKNLAPYVVQYSAGLIQHYFEIVNHPPYVVKVSVHQKGNGNEAERYYSAEWGNAEDTVPNTDTIKDVMRRELRPTELKDRQPEPLRPGLISVSITFSEPVRDVKVRVGDSGRTDEINALPDLGNTIWAGVFEIPEDKQQYKETCLSIEASDLNRHYRDVDGQLDADPSTPAKQRVSGNGYSWGESYLPKQSHADINHCFYVVHDEDVPVLPDPSIVKVTLERAKASESKKADVPKQLYGIFAVTLEDGWCWANIYYFEEKDYQAALQIGQLLTTVTPDRDLILNQYEELAAEGRPFHVLGRGTYCIRNNCWFESAACALKKGLKSKVLDKKGLQRASELEQANQLEPATKLEPATELEPIIDWSPATARSVLDKLKLNSQLIDLSKNMKKAWEGSVEPSPPTPSPKPPQEMWSKAVNKESDNDSLLGVHWQSSDQKKEDKAAPPPSAPKTENEVRQALGNMGFKIVEKATFGNLSGYYIEITDSARAAQFGFKERKQARAGYGITGIIGCWTEQKGNQLIIWIDWSDVEIRDDSKLPPYVKLYAK